MQVLLQRSSQDPTSSTWHLQLADASQHTMCARWSLAKPSSCLHASLTAHSCLTLTTYAADTQSAPCVAAACVPLVVQGDQLYIQMELCGDSLAAMARLRDRQPWREAELVGLLKQVRTPTQRWWQSSQQQRSS